jgi:drug/metabolite transporter (DMT)-like permease
MTERSSTRGPVALAFVLLLVGAFFWGLNASASKLLYAPDAPVRFDAIGLFTARSAWCLPGFALMIWAKRKEFATIRRADWKLFALASLTYGPMSTGLYALGVARTSAAHGALFFALGPPITAALGATVLRERLDRRDVLALVLGVLGGVMLTFFRTSTGASPVGDAMIAVMIFSVSITTLVVRALSRRYSPLLITGMYGFFGALSLVVAGSLLGHGGAIAKPLTTDLRTFVVFDCIMVVGLSLVGQLVQPYGLKRLPVAVAAAVTLYGSLAVGVVASIVLVHESITPLGIVAGVLLAAALGLAIAPKRGRADVFLPEPS